MTSVLLEDACKRLEVDALLNFNDVGPDCGFKIVDAKARMLQLAKRVGLESRRSTDAGRVIANVRDVARSLSHALCDNAECMASLTIIRCHSAKAPRIDPTACGRYDTKVV